MSGAHTHECSTATFNKIIYNLTSCVNGIAATMQYPIKTQIDAGQSEGSTRI
jgi:hypothetical protein